MTWLEKMDAVLSCLSALQATNPKFTDLQDWLSKNYQELQKGEIQDITLYLWKEGMMYFDDGGGHRLSEYDDRKEDAHYLISCKGKLFLEGIGGFNQQNINRLQEIKDSKDRNQRMERNEEKLVEWTRILAVRTHSLRNWTKAVALGAIGLVVWEIIAFLLEHYWLSCL